MMNLPFDVLNIFLEYDGRIKYIHKSRIYQNIISKNDYRNDIVTKKIEKKIILIQNLAIGNIELPFYVDIYYKNQELGLIFCKKLM